MLSPEKNIQQQNLQTREALDADLRETGAHYSDGTNTEGRRELVLTSEQIEEARLEMDGDLAARTVPKEDRPAEDSPVELEKPEEVTEDQGEAVQMTSAEIDALEYGQEKRISLEREQELLTAYQRTKDERVMEIILREYEWLTGMVTRRVKAYTESVYGTDIANSIDWSAAQNAGRLGIYLAASRYKFDKGARFATYADYYVFGQAIDSVKSTMGAIRIPYNAHEDVARARKTAHTSQKSREKLNTIFKVINLLDESRYLPADDVEDREDGMKDVWLRPSEVLSSSEQSVPSMVESDLLADELLELVMQLPTRWRDVMIERYGLMGDPPQRLEVLARKYGKSRERIRQIEGQSLRCLRKSALLLGWILEEQENEDS